MKPSVYLAGPIGGLTFDKATDWRNDAATYLKRAGITAFDPMRWKSFMAGGVMASNANAYDHPLCTSKGIQSRDYNDVRRCDALLINLLPCTKVSIGTVMEIAWAFMLQKPVVVVAESDDIHVIHPMMTESIPFRVDTLEEGLDLVRTILCPE